MTYDWLINLRKEIDKIDTQILNLLKKRKDIGLCISLNKRKQGIPIKDEEREKHMFESFDRMCEKAGLNKDFVRKLFRQIIDENIRVMENDYSNEQ